MVPPHTIAKKVSIMEGGQGEKHLLMALKYCKNFHNKFSEISSFSKVISTLLILLTNIDTKLYYIFHTYSNLLQNLGII